MCEQVSGRVPVERRFGKYGGFHSTNFGIGVISVFLNLYLASIPGVLDVCSGSPFASQVSVAVHLLLVWTTLSKLAAELLVQAGLVTNVTWASKTVGKLASILGSNSSSLASFSVNSLHVERVPLSEPLTASKAHHASVSSANSLAPSTTYIVTIANRGSRGGGGCSGRTCNSSSERNCSRTSSTFSGDCSSDSVVGYGGASIAVIVHSDGCNRISASRQCPACESNLYTLLSNAQCSSHILSNNMGLFVSHTTRALGRNIHGHNNNGIRDGRALSWSRSVGGISSSNW